MPKEPTQQELEQLRHAIFAQRKIEAIKLYRQFSGCDLKEAKDHIEKLQADLQLSHPEKFAPKPKGCATSIAILALVLIAIFFFMLRGNAAEKLTSTSTSPLPSLQEALDSKQDLWGLAAMRQTNGPSYEFFENLLPPLRYVNAAFRHYPIVLSAPGALVKARLISNGSAVNALAKLNTWKEVGTPITFRVGTNSEMFGENLPRLRGPFYEKEHLPIVHLRYENEGVFYEQETFAATESPLAEHGVVFVRFKNCGGKRGGNISAQIDSKIPLTISGETLCDTNGATLVWFSKDWKWSATNQMLTTSLARGRASLVIATAAFASAKDIPDFAAQKKSCIATWESVLAKAMCVEVPEPIVNAAWRSTIVGSFLLLRGDHMNYSAGNAYQVMYEAESGDNVRALLLWNLRDDVRRMIPPLLDYGINPGLKFHDAAFKLQLLAHYFWLTRDAQFIREQKPRWSKFVEILTDERDSSTALLPKENYCGDEFDKVFSLNSNANGWRGLRDIAAVLDQIGEGQESQRISVTANALKKATMAAAEKSERNDVLPTFVPIALFGEEKPYDVLTATRRGSYWNLMIPYVIGSGIFAGSEHETAMLRYLEEHGGICMGMIRFHQHSGLFANVDGLDDLYGLRYDDALLRRDEPERAIVSFYGKLAQGMTRNTFLSAEGTSLRPLDEFGRPMYLPPTCSGNALFLWQLRSMLVQDYDLDNNGQPETLRLLFATPKRWLENGKEIKIENAPTAFGEVSIHLKSRLNNGEIVAEIEMPKRNAPEKTLLRFRVPDGWKITSATAGSKSLPIDDSETIDISKLPPKFTVHANVKRL